MSSSNKKYRYLKPDPFATPFLWEIPPLGGVGPVKLIPRETMIYSAKVIEEIMSIITLEYDFRKMTLPVWKRYKSSNTDFVQFSPKADGRNVKRIPLIFFSKIISDIQNAIQGLLNDTNVPDDLGSLMARIFTNLTSNSVGGWKDNNKLKNNIIVKGSNGNVILNPLNNAILGNWPFDADSTHVKTPISFMGIDFNGIPNVKNKAGSIESSAPDWPSSVIGKTRTEQNYPVEGQNTTGVDGIDIPMKPAGRPGPSNRINEANTSTNQGAGEVDLDGGYSFLSHQPAVIQQLRYQPPIIETFGREQFAERWYTSNIYSTTTHNIPWHLSQPVAKQWIEDWGFWLIKGKCGISNNRLTLGVDDQRYVSSPAVTNCPFSVFYFAPATPECTCTTGETAYAVWVSNMTPINFDGVPLIQISGTGGNPKIIGPKTRLRFKHSFSSAPASYVLNSYMEIRLSFSSLGNPATTPFVVVYAQGSPLPSDNIYNIASSNSDIQTHSDGSKSIGLFNYMDKIVTGYSSKVKQDVIFGININVVQTHRGSIPCTPTPTGSVTHCINGLQCGMGKASATFDYIMFYEPSIESANDPRFGRV